MIAKAKIALGALCLAAFLCAGLYIKSLRADLAGLRAAEAALRLEAESTRRELAAGRAALQKREAELRAAASADVKLKSELRGEYEKDEAARTWADDCVPGAVCDRLRGSLSAE